MIMMSVRSIWSKLLSLVLAVALIVPVLAVPSSAATIETSADIWFFLQQEDNDATWQDKVSIMIPRDFSSVSQVHTWEGSTSYSAVQRIKPSSFSVELDSLQSGAVSIYFSFFMKSDYVSGFLSLPDWSDNWALQYVDQDGVVQQVPATVTTYDSGITAPVAAGVTSGYNVNAKLEVEDGQYATRFALIYKGSSVARFRRNRSGQSMYLYVPSASLVAAESSAELGALEDMADQIAQQNDLLQSMYGDIISLLQSIYTNTGDMEAALNLANQYLQTMSGYLQGILGNTSSIYQIMSTYMHYLQDISETADDIYSEFQSFHADFLAKMSELIGIIQSESDDIQATMDRLMKELMDWLDEQFSGAADPDLSGNSQTVSGNIQQSDAISSQFTGSMSSQFGSLNLGSFTFGTGMISALTFVSSLWMSFYENAGEYQIIILLPMYIGISLLVSGMARKLVNRGGDGKHD